MLESLNWPTLERRRQQSRLSMLNKISTGLVHCPSLKAKLIPLPSSLDNAEVTTLDALAPTASSL
jgi:hypothetical protein